MAKHTTVIDWFKLLPQKDKSRFVYFQIQILSINIGRAT